MNLDSTEILRGGILGKAWIPAGKLPKARNGMRATNVNNIIYALGMETGKREFTDILLRR